MKFSHCKRKVSKEGRRINGQAQRVSLKMHSLSVNISLFGWPNFTDLALIANVLREISSLYERAARLSHATIYNY